jgi:hypothetical protein
VDHRWIRRWWISSTATGAPEEAVSTHAQTRGRSRCSTRTRRRTWVPSRRTPSAAAADDETSATTEAIPSRLLDEPGAAAAPARARVAPEPAGPRAGGSGAGRADGGGTRPRAVVAPAHAARDQGAESRDFIGERKRNCGGSKEGFGACGARGAQGGDRGRCASPRRARRATRALPAGPADPGRLSDEEFQRGRFRFRAETGVHRRRQGAGPEGPRAGPDAPRGPLATPRRVIPEAPRRPGARGHLARSRRRHRRGGGDDAMRAIRPARRVRPRRPAAFVPGSESAARGARVGARVSAIDVRRGRARFLRRVPRRRGSTGRRRPRGCNREDGVGSVAWRGVARRGCPAGCRGGGRGRRVGVREGGFRVRV